MLDGLSLASIFFLAAIGLAITFGVMGVINMAHGEFIMIGAYTGTVVQPAIPDYTVSLLIALPLGFVVTFGTGVAMERLVIRHLYTRPLETMRATFGISIALQQLAKNIFGTQARPPSPRPTGWAVPSRSMTSSASRRSAWQSSCWPSFSSRCCFTSSSARLGLELRAVTQNPGMAASMRLNPSNTLAAQTWMVPFVILFIQFRPKGIVALKGRAAGA